MSARADHSPGAADPDWTAFVALDQMVNHWDRPGWRPGRSAYYWYLSFRDQQELRGLAERCQAAVAEPHFDLVPPSDLHMTLERVAFAEEIDDRGRETVEKNAARALDGFAPFDLQIGPLAGSAGALSFSAFPKDDLVELRLRLLGATHSAGFATNVSGSSPFRPHVGIGYCNRTVDAAPIIAKIHALRVLPPVDVRIREAVLVALTRHERAYSWDVVHRVPFAIVN